MLDPRVAEVLWELFGEEPLAAQSMMYYKPPGARGRRSVMARIRAAVGKLLPPGGADEYESPGPAAPPRDKGGDA